MCQQEKELPSTTLVRFIIIIKWSMGKRIIIKILLINKMIPMFRLKMRIFLRWSIIEFNLDSLVGSNNKYRVRNIDIKNKNGEGMSS